MDLNKGGKLLGGTISLFDKNMNKDDGSGIMRMLTT
jgi:hypothetical protein